VKLLDFGLAKITSERVNFGASAEEGSTISWDPVSSPDSVIGTVGYMSPEQALGKVLDSRCDLFSLGAVLYEMATGVVPFAGTTSAAIFDSILNKQPVSPVHLNPALPEELDHIIRKALEKDREVRYQTAAEVQADLKRLKRDTSSDRASGVAVPVATVAGASRRWRWAAVAGLLLALTTGVAWYFSPVATPRVIGSTEITHDGLIKGHLVTDGSRIYFSESSGGHFILAQVSVTGGEASEIHTPFRNLDIGDISADHSQLLVGSFAGTYVEALLWALPLPSGSPRPGPAMGSCSRIRGILRFILRKRMAPIPRSWRTSRDSPWIFVFPPMGAGCDSPSIKRAALSRLYGKFGAMARTYIPFWRAGKLFPSSVVARGRPTGVITSSSAGPIPRVTFMPWRNGPARSIGPRRFPFN